MFAASALAANTVARSAAGTAAPLFTQYMFDALGVGGGGSLIGGVAILLATIPFIFYKYSEPIRKRFEFAPTEENPEDASQGPSREHQNETRSDVSSVDSNARREMGIDRTSGPDNIGFKALQVARAQKRIWRRENRK
jgi:DHA1 family multidrug resistance protein-like MFS transporter